MTSTANRGGDNSVRTSRYSGCHEEAATTSRRDEDRSSDSVRLTQQGLQLGHVEGRAGHADAGFVSTSVFLVSVAGIGRRSFRERLLLLAFSAWGDVFRGPGAALLFRPVFLLWPFLCYAEDVKMSC
ncbi:hypothetical protein NL676_030006 [Syzygium grande]|nr:hypothetical protein NL676_030006 [Syzygium grande]